MATSRKPIKAVMSTISGRQDPTTSITAIKKMKMHDERPSSGMPDNMSLPTSSAASHTTPELPSSQNTNANSKSVKSSLSPSKSLGSTVALPPPNWERVLENIREMRITRDAPVDKMGANDCSTDTASPQDRRFHVLVSLMLSSQTKDQKKVGYLHKTCELLKAKHGGDIPDSVAGLCQLPGVGPKMAHLCMELGWGRLTGIGVDTHVHRISNRLGWTGSSNTTTAEGTRKALEEWLPKQMWSDANLLLVGFGQQTCLALRPKCSDCLNYQQQLCPSANPARSPSKSPKKKRAKTPDASSA